MQEVYSMHTAQHNHQDPCDPLPAHRSFVTAQDVDRMKDALGAWLSKQEPNVNCAAGQARAGCAFHVRLHDRLANSSHLQQQCARCA